MIVLEVQQADVTRLEVDAITNAANTQLKHGGGVAAAISRAGGPAVQRESDEKAPIGLGDAVETTAGDMPARYVIHAATMELGGPTSAEIITQATRSTLAKADELGCRSLALVAFGTGVGGFPLDEAARLMVDAARGHEPRSLERWCSPCTATRPSGRSVPPSKRDGPAAPTIGVEEEYFVVDPASRTPTRRSPRRRARRPTARPDPGEFTRYQTEVKRPPGGRNPAVLTDKQETRKLTGAWLRSS